MYLVMFTSPEGKQATHHDDTLDAAIKFIEHIRNNEGVSEARVYRLTEVPLEVKAYYKVEIAGAPDNASSLGTTTESAVSSG